MKIYKRIKDDVIIIDNINENNVILKSYCKGMIIILVILGEYYLLLKNYDNDMIIYEYNNNNNNDFILKIYKKSMSDDYKILEYIDINSYINNIDSCINIKLNDLNGIILIVMIIIINIFKVINLNKNISIYIRFIRINKYIEYKLNINMLKILDDEDFIDFKIFRRFIIIIDAILSVLI